MLDFLLNNFKKDKQNNLHDENQYLNLISYIISNGKMIEGRNGNVLTVIGCPMHFDLTNNILPILTTKQMAWKTCIKELLWFISGSTDNKLLKEQNVNIWNLNGSREFLDSRNLENLEEDDLGPIYGHQWRHFNADYKNCHLDYKEKGIDQLQYVIDCLKDPKERYSRRIIMSSWNPCQIPEMSLPPCHVLAHFNVVDEHLSCILYQRSGDVGLGVPFNITSYCVLTHLLAIHCGLIAKEFIYYLGNCHIYEEHIENLKIQLERTPINFPKINIDNIKDKIEDYNLEDLKIENYKSHEKINLKLR